MSLGENVFGNKIPEKIIVPYEHVDAYKSGWSRYESKILGKGREYFNFAKSVEEIKRYIISELLVVPLYDSNGNKIIDSQEYDLFVVGSSNIIN